MGTYCTVADVSSLLQLRDASGNRLVFSSETQPTSTEVETFISSAEDEIDRATNNSWRTKTVTEEYHHLNFIINLRHSNILSITKIEVYNNGEWEVISLLEEGIDKDWTIDKEFGLLRLNNYQRYSDNPDMRYWKRVRVSYTWGNSSVSAQIKRATSIRAGLDILIANDYTLVTPESTSVPTEEKKIEWYEKKYKEIIEMNTIPTIL